MHSPDDEGYGLDPPTSGGHGGTEASPGGLLVQPGKLSAARPLYPEASTRPNLNLQRFPLAAPQESAVYTPRKP